MKLVFFTKYTRAGASSRYRSFQYLPALEAAGLRFIISPLLDDAYLVRRYTRDARIHAYDDVLSALSAFGRRLWAGLTVPSAALVVIEYELLPWLPAVFERWLAWRGCRMVVDYDDAIFHQYDAHPNPWVRRLLGRKIATVMRLANTVVAGNAYLADYARQAGARRVIVIPTVIDLFRYPVVGLPQRTELFTIGWIGSPSTARYLRAVAPALANVCADARACVRLIGAGAADLPGVSVDAIPWREETEVDEIRRCDVGIMPLPDEPWARCKCGFKLIQYMACGLPVVASPVGVNQQIVEHGVNGFLVQTHQEWLTALDTLRNDPALRARMGAAGRRKVETTYCLQVTASQYVRVLRQAGMENGD